MKKIYIKKTQTQCLNTAMAVNMKLIKSTVAAASRFL